MALLPVVDKNNKIIGYKERKNLLSTDIFRATGLLLINKQGQILIARRSKKKASDPGRWGPSVAGTVEKGETYRMNVTKEAREEIGVSLNNVKLGPRILIKQERGYFGQWYFSRCNLPINKFKLQKSEVIAVQWMNRSQLKKEIKMRPKKFVRSARQWVKILQQIR